MSCLLEISVIVIQCELWTDQAPMTYPLDNVIKHDFNNAVGNQILNMVADDGVLYETTKK